jgi:hypothetical protein
MIDEYGAFDGRELVGKTEVLGENSSQCHFIHHKPHMT